jgi:hypothetical protein
MQVCCPLRRKCHLGDRASRGPSCPCRGQHSRGGSAERGHLLHPPNWWAPLELGPNCPLPWVQLTSVCRHIVHQSQGIGAGHSTSPVMLTLGSSPCRPGAALLDVQPGMKRASAGEVAAVLSRGVLMHKAWIHDTKHSAAGSTRWGGSFVCCTPPVSSVHSLPGSVGPQHPVHRALRFAAAGPFAGGWWEARCTSGTSAA